MTHRIKTTKLKKAASPAALVDIAPKRRRDFRSTGEHRAAIGMLGATVKDLSDFQAATTRAYELMQDGQWHTRREIQSATNQWEGVRRVRELRQLGYIIECDRASKDARNYRYRLVNPEETSTEVREAQTYARA